MSGSDWRKHLKAGLAIGIPVAILCAFIVLWGLSESARYQGEADYHRSEYAKDTAGKVEQTCIRLTPVEKAKCIGEATDEKRAYERDEQDLVAQRQSALWAYIMGAAAVVGMGLSAVGVFLVWTTFNETRRANAIAINTAKLQLRPYVFFVSDAENVDDRPFTRGERIPMAFKNYGQTPAKNVRIYIGSDIVKRPIGDRILDLNDPVGYYGYVGPGALITDYIVADTPVSVIADIASGMVLLLRVRIEYDIPTGGSDKDDRTWMLTSDDLKTGRFRQLSERERHRD